MTLIIPKMALVPKNEEPGPRTISIWSMRSRSSGNSVADESAVINVVVQAMAIDHQQNAGVVVAGALHSAHAEVGVIAVIRGVEATQAAEDIAEGSPAMLLDVIRSDDTDRGRSLARIFEMARGAENLGLGQVFETDRHQILIGRGLGRGGSQEEQHGEEGPYTSRASHYPEQSALT